MSQELEPIRLEVAMEVDGTISQADQLDVSMKKLDVSTEKTKKKFEQQTQKLIENGRQMNANTQAVKKYAETVQEQVQATQRQNESLTKSTQKFNSLGNSVNQITRELPAFTYSALKMHDAITDGTVFWLNAGIDRGGDIAYQDWCFIPPNYYLNPKERATDLWSDQANATGQTFLYL